MKEIRRTNIPRLWGSAERVLQEPGCEDSGRREKQAAKGNQILEILHRENYQSQLKVGFFVFKFATSVSSWAIQLHSEFKCLKTNSGIPS